MDEAGEDTIDGEFAADDLKDDDVEVKEEEKIEGNQAEKAVNEVPEGFVEWEAVGSAPVNIA